MSNFDLTNLAVKMVCPTNEVVLDDKGLPSVMVKIPKFKISDVITGGSDSTHPAFIVNGSEVPAIYISKYQNKIQDGRAYSLPGEDPAASINFDNARLACEAKGPGWHLMTNAEWAAIALWCKKNGTMPRGNNNYGKDTVETIYKAIPTTVSGTQTNRVATGTGPIEWSHDKTLEGIWDLKGNVWEWVGGYRTNNGEIQILANNDAALSSNPQNLDSVLWRAILSTGALVNPGTANTLKWDYTGTPASNTGNIHLIAGPLVNQQTNDTPYGAKNFGALTAQSGVTVPEILKALALFPADPSAEYTADGGSFYFRNNGERLACRGGLWYHGTGAGVFALNGADPRSLVYSHIGFRSAFIPNIG